MDFELKILQDNHVEQFKKDMQDAFQQGAIDGFGSFDEQVLPEEDINNSLNAKGAIAYEAIVDGKMVGGAIVVISENSNHNHLDFLYVKNDMEGKGIGSLIWKDIEKKHPKTKIWETCTPYFDKRNIHFYINKCGFHAVEFYNRWHKDPNEKDEYGDENEYFSGMFRFEKIMDK